MRLVIKRGLVIIPIVIAGLFFRVFENKPSSLWTDEFATYWISSAHTPIECITRATLTQGQSPFYYLLEWIVLKFSPHTEMFLRLISMLASLVSIYLVFEITILFFNKSPLPSEEDKANHNTPALTSRVNYLPAIFASLLCAMDINQIYYAQEARPYALAVMFALLSQLFFIKMLRRRTLDITVIYIISSALILYTHYIFGTMVLIQNIWMFIVFLKQAYDNKYNKKTNIPMKLPQWCVIQIILIITLLPLLFHLIPIIRNSSKWTWLQKGGLYDTFTVFFTLFNAPVVIMFASVFILLFVFDYIKSGKLAGSVKDEQKKNRETSDTPAADNNSSLNRILAWGELNEKNQIGIYLVIWFLIPPFFAYFATALMHTSLLDARYMLLSLIPLYLFTSFALNMIRQNLIKVFLTSFILFAYLGGVMIPVYNSEGRFSYRIPHDWYNAIRFLNKNLRAGDVIILRSGYIKENWVPDTDRQEIIEYVKAPLKSFYFKPEFMQQHADNNNKVQIFNMTYTREIEFYDYYDKIFNNCELRKWIWIIGVNPPNTNYLISQVPEILRNSHRKYFEKDFNGVYLVLLKQREIIRERVKP